MLTAHGDLYLFQFFQEIIHANEMEKKKFKGKNVSGATFSLNRSEIFEGNLFSLSLHEDTGLP